MVVAQLSFRSPALAQPARCRSTRLPVRAVAHRQEQQAGNPVAAVALAALLTVASGSMLAADAKMVLGKQFSSTEASGSAFDMTGIKKRGLMAGKRKELMASARDKASKETNKAAEQVSKAVKK
eukprot:jgi/Astpho2/8119/Aster-03059